MFTYRLYEDGDALRLGLHFRHSDIEYLTALHGRRYMDAMEEAIEQAETAVSFVTEAGDIAGIFCVLGESSWFQTNRLSDGHPRAVVKTGREFLSVLKHNRLFCVIPDDDKRVWLLARAFGYKAPTNRYTNYLGTGINHTALWRINGH